MISERENNSIDRIDFGFGEIMASADFEHFPAWYADRCLLPHKIKKPLGAVDTAQSAFEAYAFSKEAA